MRHILDFICLCTSYLLDNISKRSLNVIVGSSNAFCITYAPRPSVATTIRNIKAIVPDILPILE